MRQVDYFHHLLQDLETVYQLCLAHNKLDYALKALELMAKVTGVLQPRTKRSGERLSLHELTDEQINSLISDIQAVTNTMTPKDNAPLLLNEDDSTAS